MFEELDEILEEAIKTHGFPPDEEQLEMLFPLNVCSRVAGTMGLKPTIVMFWYGEKLDED